MLSRPQPTSMLICVLLESAHECQACRLSIYRFFFRMSQKKKLVVYKHQVGYWKGQGDRSEFIAMTNFNLELLKFVEAPPSLPTYKGYIAKIMQLGRKHRLYEGYAWLSYIMCVTLLVILGAY